MIQVLLGDKGSGKTKQLIELANEALKAERGNIAYIDDDNRHMYDLAHAIRFVDMSEFPVVYKSGADELLGFLCGMMSADNDLSLIIIDGLKKIVSTGLESDEMSSFFAQLDKVSEAHSCKMIISISTSDAIPEFISKYTK